MISSSSKRCVAIILLAFSLLFPGTEQIQKYFGTQGVLVYVSVSSVALFFIFIQRRFLRIFLTRISTRQSFYFALATLISMTLIFIWFYPFADAGFVGGGSDNDNALNLAARELLQGRYPYYVRTYLGNPVGGFPGSIVLSLPFALLGNIAYQNLFWLGGWYLTTARYLKDSRSALLLLWLIAGLCPTFWQQLITGTDRISSSIYILIFILFLLSSLKQKSNSFTPFIASILLGVGLSSRINFLLLFPLVFFEIAKMRGNRAAIFCAVITGLGFLMMTLPFFLYDPASFSPLWIQYRRIAHYDAVLPFSGPIIILSEFLLALGLALRDAGKGEWRLMFNCSIVQALPVIAVVVLSSLSTKSVDFGSAGYGTHFMFFGALAGWQMLTTAWVTGRESRSSPGLSSSLRLD